MADILVAGGGIAGLATALGVARKGHRVTVLEARGEYEELGAGIQLAPNAFRALDHLGVGDQVREGAVFIDELMLMDGTTGLPITRMPLGEEFRHRFANPYAVVHRHDLYRPLLAACRETDSIVLHSGNAVRRYEQDRFGVTVILDSGDRLRGAALIGADGLHSTVRRQVVNDGEPRVSGHTIYRSVIPVEHMPEEFRWNAAVLWAGPKCHIVHYPIGGWRYFNLAVTRDNGATVPVAGQRVANSLVRREFEHMYEVPRRLIEYGQNWKAWVVCDRDPVPRWTDERVVLVGDAAHPMLQYAAQGAAMALEDAVCLSGMVEPDANLVDVFERFNAVRAIRTSTVQTVSRRLGEEVYHPAGERALARNARLALTTEELYDQVSWLYEAEVTAKVG
jgi:3-hydroxybenzoate 6-monooxygenase